MTYAFTHEEISLSSLSSGWDLGFWTQIKALGFGLRAGIWALMIAFVLEALRLRFVP